MKKKILLVGLLSALTLGGIGLLSSCDTTSDPTNNQKEEATFTLSYNNDLGTVKIFNEGPYKIGDTIIVNVTSNTGYAIGTVKLNGTQIKGANGNYRFTLEEKENTLEVTFYFVETDESDFTFEPIENTTNEARILAYKTTHEIPNPVVLPETVTINNKTYNVTTLGTDFATGIDIKGIKLSKNLVNIEENAINKITSLTSIEVDAENPKFSAKDGILLNKTGDSIAIFPTYKAVGEYSVDSSIKGILTGAFMYNTNITKLDLHEGITNIESYAFSYMSKLRSVNIPSSITVLPDRMFDHCTYLDDVTLNEGITEIGVGSFAYCTKIRWTSFPKTLKKIGNEAFYHDENFLRLTFGNNLEEIGDYAFSGSRLLESINVESSVKKIGEGAFEGCDALSSVTLSEGLEEIGSAAFYADTLLFNVHIPKSVKTLGDNPFLGATELHATVEEGSEYFEVDEAGVLYNKGKTKLISVPCTGLKITNNEYIFPSTLEIMPNNSMAFNNDGSLYRLQIPRSVKEMITPFKNLQSIGTLQIDYEGTKEEFEEIYKGEEGSDPWYYLANFKDNVLHTLADGGTIPTESYSS